MMETEISTEISTGPLSRYLPVCRAQLCYSLQSTSQAWSGWPATQASHRRAAASVSGNMNTYILDTAVIIQISEVICIWHLGIVHSTIFAASLNSIYESAESAFSVLHIFLFHLFQMSPSAQHSQSKLHLTSWFSQQPRTAATNTNNTLLCWVKNGQKQTWLTITHSTEMLVCAVH